MSDTHKPEFLESKDVEWEAPGLSELIEAKGYSADGWDDLSDEQKSDISDHFVWTRTEFPPENFGELVGPVVDSEGNLVLSALRNAKARATQVEGVDESDIEQGIEIIDELANDNFDASFGDEESQENSNQETIKVRSSVEQQIEDQQGPDGYEFRDIGTDGVEFRAEEEGRLKGFPAVFDVPHELQGFKEVFRKGAFKKTIEERGMKGTGIVALFNHNPDFPLGRQGKGTLDLEERDRGLFIDADLPDSPLGQNVREMVSRGDVSRGSIGMKVIRDEFQKTEDDEILREVKEVKLRDVGPATFAASKSTSMEARAGEQGNILTRAHMKHDLDVLGLIDILRRTENGEIRSETDKEKLRSQISYLKSLLGTDKIQSQKKKKLDARLNYAEKLV